MEPRARIRTLLRRAGISAALTALLVPAAAGTASAAKHHHHKKAKLPVVTSVRPMKAHVGDTLTIRGRNFRPGINKNTVAFQRTGTRVVFVKARLGTRKMLRVVLPAKLTKALLVRSGSPVMTRFRLRVLAARFGKRFTSLRHSPRIGPVVPPYVTPPTPPGDGDCDGDGILNKNESDKDGDLLDDGLEMAIGTDPCKFDSDGDGVSDGFEYQSAIDLNDDEYQNKGTAPHNDILPYPGKRPYPNPLDGSDARTDYDGDGLTQTHEYALWQYTVKQEGAPYTLEPLTYSDGEQYSLSARDDQGYRHPSQLAATYDKHLKFEQWATDHGYRNLRLNAESTGGMWGDPVWNIPAGEYSIFNVNLKGADEPTSSDLDGNGWISDDERDEDADGLSNYDEIVGRMLPSYWDSCYPKETPFGVHYAGTDATDPDTDDDKVYDGADDQDHDDLPNVMELSRIRATGMVYDDRKGPVKADCKADEDVLPKPPAPNHNDAYGRVNPFNPCLPDVHARTCPRSFQFGHAPAPFDDSPAWWALN